VDLGGGLEGHKTYGSRADRQPRFDFVQPGRDDETEDTALERPSTQTGWLASQNAGLVDERANTKKKREEEKEKEKWKKKEKQSSTHESPTNSNFS
jgi:hypothetical protein